MLIPGIVVLLIFSYVPMGFIFIAFKNINYSLGFLRSPWNGIQNFAFFLTGPDAWIVTRNVIAYNIVFIALGNFSAIATAVALDGLRSKGVARFYQSVMFLPYFLSWVVVSTLAFSFLSVDLGLLNKAILPAFGQQPVAWYTAKNYWPFFLVFANLWKYTGYTSVVYFAAIAGIDITYYEASALDGASRWQTIRNIMIPLISPVIIINVILGIGRMFYGDFGLFFQLPMNNGTLFPVTNVIDTYVYRTLINAGDIGMSAAAGLYQAVVGFVLVLASNIVVRRVDAEKSLF
jgi:putative aldouronate transport system permease protein